MHNLPSQNRLMHTHLSHNLGSPSRDNSTRDSVLTLPHTTFPRRSYAHICSETSYRITDAELIIIIIIIILSLSYSVILVIAVVILVVVTWGQREGNESYQFESGKGKPTRFLSEAAERTHWFLLCWHAARQFYGFYGVILAWYQVPNRILSSQKQRHQIGSFAFMLGQ